MGVEKGLAAAAAASSYSSSSSNEELPRRRRSFNNNKPSWLLVSVADLDKRMKMVSSNTIKEDKADSFAEQAETYYQKRPQLLSLLQDLYNGYLSLADRYCRTLAKQRSSSTMKSFHLNSDEEIGSSEVDNESDAESSLSFQPPFRTPIKDQVMTNVDNIVAELVIKNVEYEIVVDEMSGEQKRWNESSRKIELQKSLLEVLESERLVLLNENARLEYRVGALAEENKELGADSLFMKRKAGELARCVLKLREDHRVCMLSRKVEDLQGQIHVLEKRNKEYYEQLVKQEGKNKKSKKSTKMKRKKDGEVTIEDCCQVDDEEAAGGNVIMKCQWRRAGGNVIMKRPWRRGGGESGRKVSKLWDKVKNFDMLLCGPHYSSACC